LVLQLAHSKGFELGNIISYQPNISSWLLFLSALVLILHKKYNFNRLLGNQQLPIPAIDFHYN
jgi:hypothetical protein